jgi:HAD superfamily hydrolase (TIGR01509 family)
MSALLEGIRGVILDVDGTLLDSNFEHAAAWHRALKAHGIEIPTRRILPLIGMGGDHLLPELTGIEETSAHGREIKELRKKIFLTEYLPRIQPFPKVRELCQELLGRGIQLAVASSSSRADLERLLEKARISDLIERDVSADDAESSKPDPDVVIAALRKLRLPPGEVLMIGDTPYDIEAACQAGIRTIALLSGGRQYDELSLAWLVLKDPEELLIRIRYPELAEAA